MNENVSYGGFKDNSGIHFQNTEWDNMAKKETIEFKKHLGLHAIKIKIKQVCP
jgi:hypothetical protein